MNFAAKLKFCTPECMNILTFTWLWPNQQQLLHGLFVRERVNALAHLCAVQVMAPVPWFLPVKWFGQRYYGHTQTPRYEKQGTLDVFHPRFIALPKIGKWSHGFCMFYGVRPALKRLRATFPFALIDAHYAYPDGYAASLLAQEFQVPYTVTVRGSDITLFAQERWRGALIRRALIGAQRVICVARSLQELVIGLGIPPEKTVVIENGVDPQKFQRIPQAEARRQLQLPRDAQIILSVGHLCERKGFHLLIDAVKMLQVAKKPDAPAMKLLIVGGEAAWDAYRAMLIRQIHEHQLQDLVSLVGPKPPEELKYWYSAADMFCLASSREGCPNVVLESLACGTPVVATAVSGTPDILSAPELGILVERNVESIHQGIAAALRRTWDHQRLVEYARKQYSWAKTAEKTYAIFETLIEH